MAIVSVFDVDNDTVEDCEYFYDRNRGRHVLRPRQRIEGGARRGEIRGGSRRGGRVKRRRIGEITDDEEEPGLDSNPNKGNDKGKDKGNGYGNGNESNDQQKQQQCN